MTKLEELIRDGKLMEYLADNDFHDWDCAAWSEGQLCCLEDPEMLNILRRLLDD